MNIIWSDHFNDDVKYYFKKKKYKNIFDDINSVLYSKKYDERVPNDAQIAMLIANIIK